MINGSARILREAAFQAGGLPHIEFRYGAADPKVRAFDPLLAEFEWSYFLRYGIFLSDPKARDLMGEGQITVNLALAHEMK